MNTILLVSLVLGAVVLGAVLRDRLLAMLHVVYFFTLWPWQAVFSFKSYSTGNNAGMMSVLLGIGVIAIQLFVVATASLIYFLMR